MPDFDNEPTQPAPASPGVRPMRVTGRYLTQVFRDEYERSPRLWLKIAAEVCPAMTVAEALALVDGRACLTGVSPDLQLVIVRDPRD